MSMDLYERLAPFPGRGKVYGTVTQAVDLGEEFFEIRLDLINHRMIEFDNRYIYNPERGIMESNPKENLYVYFAELIVDQETFSHKFANLRPDDVYEYEIIDMYEYNEAEDEKDLAWVYFSTSSISVRGYYIKQIEKVYSIPFTIPAFKHNPIDTIGNVKLNLDLVFSKPMEINEYCAHNVGQGSCNTLRFDRDFRMFFDIGISKYTRKDRLYYKYQMAFSRFNYKKYKVVILSHWDVDHYLGLCQDTTGEILKKTWIVPEDGMGTNINRIAYIIDTYGKLVRISNSLSGFIYSCGNFQLYKGNGSNKNDAGLILAIDSPKAKLIAMGDASYSHAPFLNPIYPYLDYLIVPHHGADMGTRIPFLPTVPLGGADYKPYPSEAIISVGYNPKTYNHPRAVTISALAGNQFQITRTDVYGTRRFIFK